jgi:hypothetical protein
MSAFYKSISLDQIIHVDKINDLTQEQQTVLRDELKIAVDEMLFMEKRVKSEAPSIQNDTWLHKVNKKINICNQFLRILEVQKDEKISYKNKYEDTFSNLLIKKLGKSTYEAIQQKAHMLTISELME